MSTSSRDERRISVNREFSRPKVMWRVDARKWILVSLIVFGCMAAPIRVCAEFTWGVGTHLLEVEDNNLSYLPYIRAVGASSYRDDLKWRAVESSKGKYIFPPRWDSFINSSLTQKLVPYLIIDYGNPIYREPAKSRSPEPLQFPNELEAFAAYAQVAAAHFSGRVGWYEVWNEWSGSAAGYAEVVRRAAANIRGEDHKAVVLAGGPGGAGLFKDEWLRKFSEAGGLHYVDGISIHPYVQCSPNSIAAFLSYLQQVRSAIAPNVPIYVSEVGWPTSNRGCGVPAPSVGKHMADAYLISRCFPGVLGLWWYDLHDDGRDDTNPEDTFGLYRFDWTPKEASAISARIGALNESIRCVRFSQESTNKMGYKMGTKTYKFEEMESILLQSAK